MDLKMALKQQQNECNDHALYLALAKREKSRENREIFEKIAAEEKSHYEFWKKVTKKELKPSKVVVRLYIFLAMIFGVSFSVKLIESRESTSVEFYQELSKEYSEAKIISQQEQNHEKMLIGMLEDKKLLYAGAIVLGMNDALVELTGTLSGIALAFDKSVVVGITGAIMGIAASLSMAGSAYLEAKENRDNAITPYTYALYTGASYIVTTFLLVVPFFIFSSITVGLVTMFSVAMLAILGYNFYVSVAKDQSFIERTVQMSVITFGVAIISFAIGYLVKHYFGIEI
jgi:VIT1/CCC1 family predicted Fe2+/Mn2+ transporter